MYCYFFYPTFKYHLEYNMYLVKKIRIFNQFGAECELAV